MICTCDGPSYLRRRPDSLFGICLEYGCKACEQPKHDKVIESVDDAFLTAFCAEVGVLPEMVRLILSAALTLPRNPGCHIRAVIDMVALADRLPFYDLRDYERGTRAEHAAKRVRDFYLPWEISAGRKRQGKPTSLLTSGPLWSWCGTVTAGEWESNPLGTCELYCDLLMNNHALDRLALTNEKLDVGILAPPGRADALREGAWASIREGGS